MFNPQPKAGKKPSKKAKVISRSSSTVERPLCKRVVSCSSQESGSSIDMAWADTLPWRGAMLTKAVNNDIDGIPVEPFVNKSVNNVNMSVNNSNVNRPKDRRSYMREYMAKRRAVGK